ncbi:MAG: ribonuclease HII [Lentisphaerae bacterium RIFOXYB12_FULL_65_16]|nr:MAG: ribonuclease HII [Lentisphaerae bacterium RIFOXYA12_64_32]OGV92936.1 MAG: ribonuclease HII [Lentisphaerae bacterium RIFOXYB12_FULL_65_16]
MPTDNLHFERLAFSNGYARVAGVDEVGRGPLAGPVVAVAVVLPERAWALPLADSKTLTERQREELCRELQSLPGVNVGTGVVSVADIDRLNILRATHLAMRQAVRALTPLPDFALVDGLPVPDFPVPASFVVKGDALSATIGAASIVAKVCRDRMMVELDRQYPGYGFARHKGYGTAEHLDALERLGPSPIHRRSFAPVRRLDPQYTGQQEFAFRQGNDPVSA